MYNHPLALRTKRKFSFVRVTNSLCKASRKRNISPKQSLTFHPLALRRDPTGLHTTGNANRSPLSHTHGHTHTHARHTQSHTHTHTTQLRRSSMITLLESPPYMHMVATDMMSRLPCPGWLLLLHRIGPTPHCARAPLQLLGCTTLSRTNRVRRPRPRSLRRRIHPPR
jgi:hypothetical protein